MFNLYPPRNMDFLKSLQEAERLGISRDLFIAAWEREVTLTQVKEEAKVLELKRGLASPNQVRLKLSL